MNTYSIKDEQFKQTSLFKDFQKENPSFGYLRIRAYSASEAIPIPGVQITISTIFQNNKIVYFEGETDSSGLIDRISLPTPKLVLDNLDEPNKIIYELKTVYEKENINQTYEVNMYEGICTVQNINITPSQKESDSLWL